MSGVNNALTVLFVMTDTKTCPRNQFFTKLCHKTQAAEEGFFKFVPVFSSKSWTKSCQKVELNLRKLETAVACCDFVRELSWNYFCFYFQKFTLFDYAVNGGIYCMPGWWESQIEDMV